MAFHYRKPRGFDLDLSEVKSKKKEVAIGIVLRKLAERKGVTKLQVAKDLGIPPSTFHDWNYGRVPRDLGAIELVASYFEVEFYYLVFGGDDDQKEVKDIIRKLEYENAMLKIENERQLNLFETQEQEIKRLKNYYHQNVKKKNVGAQELSL